MYSVASAALSGPEYTHMQLFCTPIQSCFIIQCMNIVVYSV